jgi:glucokinase
MNDLLLGLDIGGTKCTAVIGDASGLVMGRTQWPSRAERGPDAMIADLVSHGRDLIAAQGEVSSIGVSIGGPLDARHGIIYSPPNLPGWDSIPLRDRFENDFARPVHVQHDAAACALAERWWGAARGLNNMAYLTCGTGFGVGLILNGKVYYGASGQTCEIGHVRYREEGPIAFGKQGSFEAYCAGSSLPRLAAWRFPSRWGVEAPSPAQIAELARQGDADAKQVIAMNATAVGSACSLLADLLAPQMIVLGSLASYLGESWITQVRTAFAEQSLSRFVDACQIVPAGLGSRLQDCSALAAAMPGG